MLELVFLVGDGVLLPTDQHEADVLLLDTPTAHKLFIDLLVHEPSRHAARLPAEMQGRTLKSLGLRSGRVVHIVGRVMPLTPHDTSAIAEMRAKLRVTFSGELPARDATYIEALLHSFKAGHGNVIQIFPVGTETFAVEAARLRAPDA